MKNSSRVHIWSSPLTGEWVSLCSMGGFEQDVWNEIANGVIQDGIWKRNWKKKKSELWVAGNKLTLNININGREEMVIKQCVYWEAWKAAGIRHTCVCPSQSQLSRIRTLYPYESVLLCWILFLAAIFDRTIRFCFFKTLKWLIYW